MIGNQVRWSGVWGLVALLVCGSFAQAQIEIVGPHMVNVGQLVELEVTGLPPSDFTKPLAETLGWVKQINIVADADATCKCDLRSDLRLDFLKQSWGLVVTTKPSEPGIVVIVVDWNGEKPSLTTHRIQVGSVVPPPNPPPGPGPTPDPGPNPPPVVSTGFRVLIIEEASAPVKREILFSPNVRRYLDSKCQKDPTGRPEWYLLDDDYSDAELSVMPEFWQRVYKQAVKDSNGKLPWVWVGNDKATKSTEVPASAEALLALFKQYGGE